jgi:2,3-bisphosphoglycerate-independent phosphoglycerate mutase
VDRRAGRISEKTPLVEALSEIKEIKGIKFLITSSWQHRAVLIMRGENLSSKIEDPDPHEVGLKVKDVKSLEKEADFTASVLTEYLRKAHEILKEHPLNKKREEEGKLPGNYLLVRGAGKIEDIPPFKEMHRLKAACIAGGALYKGIARILGMDLIKVKGANGLPNTNILGKFQKAKELLMETNYQFVFLHVKATDNLAESGKYKEKTEFIERMDKEITPIFEMKNTITAITADHCTCCNLKRHCVGEVPLLIYGNGKDSLNKFSEKFCKEGSLGKIESLDFMKKLIEIAKN